MKQTPLLKKIIEHHYSDDIKLIKREINESDLGLGSPCSYTLETKACEGITFSTYCNRLEQTISPEMKKLGFEGKDRKYTKKTAEFTFLVYFYPNRYGGGFNVDFLVKVNNIKYPRKYKTFNKSSNLNLCEFSKRLAPINCAFWVWPYEIDNNSDVILQDVIRCLHEKATPFFEQFSQLDELLENLEVADFKKHPISSKYGFPSFHTDFYADKLLSIYFAFEYHRLKNNLSKASKFAKYGLTESAATTDSLAHIPYHEVFNEFLSQL